MPLYLLFGHPWLSRTPLRRQAEASQLIRHEQARLQATHWHAAEGSPAAQTAALVRRLGDFAASTGNSVELLDDYQRSLQRLIEDIDSAQTQVHLLYYLMFDDEVGEAVVAALERACMRGVQCRLLLDAVGARRGLRRYTARLRRAGVELHALLPGGLRWRRSGRMDLRNHRKLAVIDHTCGYVGSQNLASPEFVPGHPNRELVMRVSGPVVAQLASVFNGDWYIETGQRLALPVVATTQGVGVATQLLPSGPAYPFENARDTVNALIAQARRRIVLVTPYFVPDEATLSMLRIAALSGVDVQLVLSASNNQRLTAWAQQAYYEELLRCGVKIALYRPHFLHAKHLSVDGQVCLVGSINLDIRSFALNAELGLLVYDAAVVSQVAAIESDYLAHSHHMTLQQWCRRPAWQRSREGLARLADALL